MTGKYNVLGVSVGGGGYLSRGGGGPVTVYAIYDRVVAGQANIL